MKRLCSKCNTLHDHDHNCTVGKFERYYRDSETYKYRNSRHWHKIRDQAKERDYNLCTACRYLDHYYNAYRLEVHHLIDVKICINNERIDLIYDINNALTLCQHHHRAVHDGKLGLSKLLTYLPNLYDPEATPLPSTP